jgi:hypothetical protein
MDKHGLSVKHNFGPTVHDLRGSSGFMSALEFDFVVVWHNEVIKKSLLFAKQALISVALNLKKLLRRGIH